MEKKIDELIENLISAGSLDIDYNNTITIIEQFKYKLKNELKEQHKKDVIKVSQYYINEFKLWDSRNTKTLQKQIGTDLEEFTKGRIDALRSVVSFIEQYYNENH
jgi:TPP-dependent pyruvate/acetoin dehydrogenase alpha subunit